MSDGAKDESGGYRRDKRALVGWIATTLGGIAVVVGAWAHARLWDQGQAIVALQENRKSDKETTERLERKIDSLADKIDLLRELIRHNP